MAWTKNRSCNDKRQHETQADARSHIRLIQGNYLGGGLHVYLCKFCGKYHVGHRPRRKRR